MVLHSVEVQVTGDDDRPTYPLRLSLRYRDLVELKARIDSLVKAAKQYGLDRPEHDQR